MSLTVSTHYAIPSLIGKGLTDGQARQKLTEARLKGRTLAIVNGTRVLPIVYSSGKFTIG